MKIRPRTTRRWHRSLAPLVAVLLTLPVLWHARNSESENLRPRNDALEYVVLANRLRAGEPPTLPIGNRTYPSRYPIGFPLVLVPAVAAGVPPHALWLVTALIALLGVALVAWTASEMTGPLAGAWAATMLGFAPLYVYWGVRVMSDVPAAVLTAIWFPILRRARSFVATGVVAGFACSVRLMAAPLLAVSACLAARRGRDALVRLGVGASLGLAPLLLSAVWTGFAPTAGYSLWHARAPADAFMFTAVRRNLSEYAATLAGAAHPRFYSYLASPLIPLGIWEGLRSSARVPLAALLGVVVAHITLGLFYFFRSSRLLLPILPLLLLLAALGLERVRRWKPAVGVLVAVAALLVQLRAGLLAVEQGRTSTLHVGRILTAAAAHLPADGLIVSDVDAPLAWLYWTRESARTFMPVASLPAGAAGDLGDDYLRHLDRLAARGLIEPPSVFLGSTGSPGIDQGPDRATVVLCTKYGVRTLLQRLAAVRTITLLASTEHCRFAAIGRPQTR